ncbi:MAG: ATP-binding protein [Propionibacteriaceae bacterium]|jgi:hypothetical protein|nr:ATP-binding protein [Propionibacteriaceae bacterium]
MDSPYRPGFGTRPPFLAGREDLLNRQLAILSQVANSGLAAPFVTIYVGPRGVGKTTLLREIARRAADQTKLIPVWIGFDGHSDNVKGLAEALAQTITPLKSKARSLAYNFKKQLAQLSVEVSVPGLKVNSQGAEQPKDTLIPRRALTEILRSAAALTSKRKDSNGLLLVIDELQAAPMADLDIILNAVADLYRDDPEPPIAVVAAGLANTAETVAQATSFSERSDFQRVGRLGTDDSIQALLEPSLALGVMWEEPGVQKILERANGFPYLIQSLANEAWLLANPSPGSAIAAKTVDLAVEKVTATLEDGMFRSRYLSISNGEKALVEAIAQVSDSLGVATTREITALLKTTTPALSRTRESLISKGLIEAVGTGKLRFTIPGFGEYVLERTQFTDAE